MIKGISPDDDTKIKIKPPITVKKSSETVNNTFMYSEVPALTSISHAKQTSE